ncbi:YesL family protein [Guptibacillus sedimenti]|uniref:YesL family protein n=1 Tax=Guptibacillus sedimenti TaxID=3025680 RepID=UPI0023608BF4|nr:DUF624 domain-containing protein [Pseudalkalibacillus sedimenti]
MSGWEKFSKAVYWMLKAAYINLLWILFTLVGLGFFGFFPATIAMFTVVREWFKNNETPIFRTFWETFRKEFIKGNAFGLIFIFIGSFLFYDFQLLNVNEGNLKYFYPVLILVSIAYVFTLLFFFSVYVHFKLTFFQYLKQSFLVAAASPMETLLIVISIILIGVIITLIPGIIPLFTGSILAIITTWLSNRAFKNIEKKQLKHKT